MTASDETWAGFIFLVLARQGAKVIVTDIDQEECQLVVEEVKKQGGEAIAFKSDVSN